MKTAVVIAVLLVTVHTGRVAAVFQQLAFKNKARTDATAVHLATLGLASSKLADTGVASAVEANGACVQS